MPVVRPKDVLAAIEPIWPFSVADGSVGRGVIPLNDATVDALQAIVGLTDHIPAELHPQGEELRAYTGAKAAIKEGIFRARNRDHRERTLFPAPVLMSIPEFDGLNPLALLKRTLSKIPNLTAKEIRAKLLELIAQHEKSGNTTTYKDSTAADALGIPIAEVRRQMAICADDDSVTLTQFIDGQCSARMKPKGWKALEERGSATEGVIFISCGQFTPEERRLGQDLSAAVDELTPYRGYFAQNESSLDGLSKNVFSALKNCVGLIAVMHRRGNVKTLNGEHLRGSVWVEQEIGIAAYLTQAEGRDIPVVLYIQDGIALEGVRQQLQLNPVPFKDSAEVMADFRSRIRDLFPAVLHIPTAN
jgi:hypothetical protein